jgi:hypothetical protein
MARRGSRDTGITASLTLVAVLATSVILAAAGETQREEQREEQSFHGAVTLSLYVTV